MAPTNGQGSCLTMVPAPERQSQSCGDVEMPSPLYTSAEQLIAPATGEHVTLPCMLEPSVARVAPRRAAGALDGDLPGPIETMDTSLLPAGSILLNVYSIEEANLFQTINRACTANDKVQDCIGSVFHAGVEAYGVEWSYGFTQEENTGVYRVPPRAHGQHTYCVTVNMGLTHLSTHEVEASLHGLMDRWRGPDYSAVHHSCLDFCNAFCKVLGVGRIPGWVDRFSRTMLPIDSLSRRTADSLRSTKHLAKTVSEVGQNISQEMTTISQEVEQAVSDARREVPRLAEAGVAGAQALSIGLMEWGQGLLGAAARALGDVEPKSRHHTMTRGDVLRTSLRNRGGVPKAGRRPVAEVLKAVTTEEAVDAFLLSDLPQVANQSTQEFPAPAFPVHVPTPPSSTDVSEATVATSSSVKEDELASESGSDSDLDLAFVPALSSSECSSSGKLEEDSSLLTGDSTIAVTDLAASWVALPQLPATAAPSCAVVQRLYVADATTVTEDTASMPSCPPADPTVSPSATAPTAHSAAAQPRADLDQPGGAVTAEATSASSDCDDEWTML